MSPQVVRWKVLLFSGTFNYQLNVAHNPVDNTVIFKMLQSSFMSACEGRWKLSPVVEDDVPQMAQTNISTVTTTSSSSPSDGSSSTSVVQVTPRAAAEAASTLIEHTLSVRITMQIPDAITQHIAPIFQGQVHTVMEDLLKEIQRQEMQRREALARDALLQASAPL